MRNPREVLKRPVVSEKSLGLMEENKYTFIVDTHANKIEIKHAVEEIFKVSVLDVRTMHVKGKFKRQGKFSGYTSDKKKAIVTLKAGDKIEVYEGL
ncbi:MAG TPA: 50S ribosomal protein L23 [Candidatus Deferrimicrobium sp.]|nr:50S ribosomal protein L23 [Candidatus Deferrimicrobium sp.]